MSDRSRILFYDHLVVVPNSEPARSVVMMNPSGIPQELLDDLTCHQTRPIDDVKRSGNTIQYTTWALGHSYRVTMMDRQIYVVRQLDFK